MINIESFSLVRTPLFLENNCVIFPRHCINNLHFE